MGNKFPIITVDLDGTLCDDTKRWEHHFPDGSDGADDATWESYFQSCVNDPVFPMVAEMVRAWNLSYDIHLVTGRSATARAATVTWLEENAIPYTALYMRPKGDRRSNTDLKVGVITNLHSSPDYGDIHLHVDDHPGVVRALNSLGFATMLIRHPSHHMAAVNTPDHVNAY